MRKPARSLTKTEASRLRPVATIGAAVVAHTASAFAAKIAAKIANGWKPAIERVLRREAAWSPYSGASWRIASNSRMTSTSSSTMGRK